MNWVDLVVLLLAVLAAISGGRQGVVIALPALVGVLLGAIAGIKLAPVIIDMFANPAVKVMVALAVVIFLVALGETLGVWVGRKIKERVHAPKLSGVDSTLGAIVQGGAVFAVAWLIALPLTSVAGLPGLASAINNSVVLGGVNQVMPDSAQGLPNELRKLLDVSDFPKVVSPFQKAPITEIGPPDPALQSLPVVQGKKNSVLKIRGNATSCSRALEGSGFVIAPQRVMTNAHVVAGTDEVAVETRTGLLPARVVHYDPHADVAVLSVPRLDEEPLVLAEGDAKAGDDAIALGYPLDGPYTAIAARVRNRTNLRGPDIYESSTVVRDVFTVRAPIRSGNSGGPLVDRDGNVIGVVFGAAVEDPETGFALTADEVRDEVANAPGMTQRVGTGPCAA